MQRLRAALVGTAVACLALPLGIASAVADDHDDDGLDHEVLATGLDGPRGLDVDRKGDVWFAQAGRGGDSDLCIPPLGAPTDPPRCLGATGKISVLREHDDDHDRRGHHDHGYAVHDVITGLPSLAPQGEVITEAVGPSDVVVDRRGNLQATVGLGADPTLRTTPLGGGLADELATVRAVNPRGFSVRSADIGAFEAASNPAGDDLDTNPHSMAWSHGVRYVADAGGNSLLTIARDGTVSTRYVFPPEAEVPNPFVPGEMVAADAVPNSVVQGPDGAIYVGQLTGFPFTPGAATVWRFEATGEPTVYADGFTNIIDLAFDDDGNLLVLEIAHNGLLNAETDPSGALIQVSRRDPSKHTMLMTAPLVLPGGITVDDDDAYISNQTVVAGAGEILKVELDD